MNTKKIIKLAAAIIIPLAIVVTIIVIKINISSKRLDLCNYIDITVDGLNDRANAIASVNTERLYERLYKDENTAVLLKSFVDSIEYTLDKAEKLSNGDVIILNVTCNEKYAKELNIKLGKLSREQEVKNLKQGTKLDAFKDIKIITSGVSPYVYLSYVNESDNAFLASLEYSFDKSEGLAIGDEFTITCNTDAKTAAAHGYFFDTLSMKAKVTDTDKYVDSITQIDSEILQNLIDGDMEFINSEVADTTFHMSYKIKKTNKYLYRDGNEKLEQIEHIKSGMLLNNLGVEEEHENYLVIFLKGTVQIPLYNGKADPYEHLVGYFACIYPNAIRRHDGSFAIGDRMEYVCADSEEKLMTRLNSVIGEGYTLLEE